MRSALSCRWDSGWNSGTSSPIHPRDGTTGIRPDISRRDEIRGVIRHRSFVRSFVEIPCRHPPTPCRHSLSLDSVRVPQSAQDPIISLSHALRASLFIPLPSYLRTFFQLPLVLSIPSKNNDNNNAGRPFAPVSRG